MSQFFLIRNLPWNAHPAPVKIRCTLCQTHLDQQFRRLHIGALYAYTSSLGPRAGEDPAPDFPDVMSVAPGIRMFGTGKSGAYIVDQLAGHSIRLFPEQRNCKGLTTQLRSGRFRCMKTAIRIIRHITG